MKYKDLIDQLTLEEKAALLGGKGEWDSRDIPRLGIPSMIMSDGPHGLRRQAGAGDHLGLNASLPATCFPTAATMANSWDRDLGTEPGCANNELLNTVLRDEWGFVGMVETDYNGSYGYQITDHCIRNGNDLMLGFNGAASNVLSDQSATAVKAMRQACKNILYTVGNSGYYTINEQTTGGLTRMQKIFYGIDALTAAIVIIPLVLVFMNWKKKSRLSSVLRLFTVRLTATRCSVVLPMLRTVQ